MAKEIKFTDEEQKRINDLRVEVAGIFTQLGQLSIEKKRRMDEVEKIEQELRDRHGKLAENEQDLYKELNAKYGDGNYDPETGIFTPIEKKEEEPAKA